MYFLVDEKRKIIFGWSAKCGCSHVKRIFYYLQGEGINYKIHTGRDYSIHIPMDIENYTTLLFIRNPYKRIVSGFLDKYRKGGQCRHLWKNSNLSFSNFVSKLGYTNIVDYHHFTPQTTERFNKKILLSKNIKFYDIENIDYKYIETLFNKKIPSSVINWKLGHERQEKEKKINNYVYNLNIDDYYNYNVDIKYFFNEEIKEKVYNFYINDFNFFKDNKHDYTNTEFLGF